MTETDLQLLTSMYQNCKTAIQSIHDIIPKVNNADLMKELKQQYDEYMDLSAKYLGYAHSKERVLPDNTIFEKTRLWMSIKMSTIFKKNTRHLAEMLLLGTVMGTLQCYKDLSDHSTATPELLDMCKELLNLQEKYFENYKVFLRDIK
ncbi:MAG: hypothetical protein IKC79_02495 [Clostridia bacterium]|nr:hypothetical protein [Clostridia bacterium]